MAKSLLHLVFGGEVRDPQGLAFVDTDRLDIVGVSKHETLGLGLVALFLQALRRKRLLRPLAIESKPRVLFLRAAEADAVLPRRLFLLGAGFSFPVPA